MSPTGVFECRVPPMGDGDLVVARITITIGQLLHYTVEVEYCCLDVRGYRYSYSQCMNYIATVLPT
jgi:hypothetical protein